ncbi:transcription factor 19 [Chiloscyllium plagiosum]|uniref:transcription factor 19 n=1 Tax=Chiloscyllium plagiosum TaxID=36176 RepID=UPI001CB7F4AB|nr:transcription factor 19 [Chiloscyllium plagiosum]
MLSEVQPCLQLLRIGTAPQPSPRPGEVPAPAPAPARDLYTFLPVGQRCTFRLGRRADLTDLCLSSGRAEELISRVHAELQAERGAAGGDWRVHIVDRSTNGTFVNDIRIRRGERTELSDGDTVTFGHPDAVNIPEGSLAAQQDSEFYFLFQRVTVRPADFHAITSPAAAAGSGSGAFRPVCCSGRRLSPQRAPRARIRSFARGTPPPAPAPAPAPRATLILDSIGSISKLRSQLLLQLQPPGTAGLGLGHGGDTKRLLRALRRHLAPDSRPPGPGPGHPPPPQKAPAKHRRKAVHTVLPDLEEEIQRFAVEVQHSAPGRRHCKSESGVDPDLYRQLTLGVRALSPERRPPPGELEQGGLVPRDSTGNAHITPSGKKRGRPRKHPLGSIPLASKVMCKVFTHTLYTAEQCAAGRCQLPQEDTVEWVQCDDCDAWYHVACVGCNYTAMKEASAEFHCGCT